jgi:hypothetical protein
MSPHTLVASTRQPIQINTATRTEITTGVGLAAICRRWRTIPCGKNADEIHIPSQTERSVLLALSGLTARAFQFFLVNGAVLVIANLQLVFDSTRERFHRCVNIWARVTLLRRPQFCQCFPDSLPPCCPSKRLSDELDRKQTGAILRLELPRWGRNKICSSVENFARGFAGLGPV